MRLIYEFFWARGLQGGALAGIAKESHPVNLKNQLSAIKGRFFVASRPTVF